MVGEKGPELMFFHGGEQVLTAPETAALQRRDTAALQVESAVPDTGRVQSTGSAPVNVQFNIQIEGNATPETVQALRDYEDDFAQKVLEVVENAAVDAARRSYR